MKKLIIFLLTLAPLIGFCQGMKITWEDSAGREFSINTHTGNFQYSMISGDNLFYNGIFDNGPEGAIKSVGGLKIYYNGRFDSGPEGAIKSTSGSVNR